MINASRFLILPLLLVTAVLAHAAGPHEAVRQALCEAAVEESALPGQMDSLLESGVLRHDQAGELLSMSCSPDATLLQLMVRERQAENLEYMTVDMGLDPEAGVLKIGGETLSLNDYLEGKSGYGDPQVAGFAEKYRELLTDESFNPSLMVQRD